MKRILAQFTIALMLISIAPTPILKAQDNVRLSQQTIELNGHSYILHKVNKGETIYSISRAYNIPSMEIMTINNLSRDNIKRSQTLLIPTKSGTITAKSGATTAKSGATTAKSGATTAKSGAAESKNQTQVSKTEVATPPSGAAVITQSNEKTVAARNTEPTVATKESTKKRATQNTATTTTAVATKLATEEPVVPQTAVIAAVLPDSSGTAATGGEVVREFTPGEPINVVIFLPLSGTSTRNDQNFIDFYKGTMIGLGRLKRSGISVNAKFISSSEATKLLADESTTNPLATANLIIGPVYPEQFVPVAAYASAHGVPIVNPLGNAGEASSPYVFEAAPTEATKYDKVLAMLHDSNVNSIVIDHIEWNDPALEQIIEDNIKGENISMIPYNSARTKTKEMDVLLTSALDKTRENVIFVPVSRDNAVEEILSRLSSINTLGQYKITVIGTPAWGWFANINLDMYFRLKVHHPTSYHADRANASVAAFYKEYLSSFGTLPSPYSFRGNDVIRYFVGAMNRFGPNMPKRVKDYNPEILQVQYRFAQEKPDGKHENKNWALVSYSPDYTVRVK